MDAERDVSKRRILLLGGSGFVGSRLLTRLASHDLHLPPPGFELRDPGQVRTVVELAQPDVIINLIGVMRGEISEMHEVHVGGTRTLVELSKERSIRLVLAGTAAEYGPIGDKPVSEDFVCSPISDYGKTKLQATEIALESGVDAVVFRPSNIIGEGMSSSLLLGSLVRQLRDGATTIELSSLTIVRDYIDVEDVADAITLLIDAPRGIYNVCSGIATATCVLVEFLRRASGLNFSVAETADPAGSSKLDYFVAEPTKLANLGFRAATPLKGSIQRVWEAR